MVKLFLKYSTYKKQLNSYSDFSEGKIKTKKYSLKTTQLPCIWGVLLPPKLTIVINIYARTHLSVSLIKGILYSQLIFWLAYHNAWKSNEVFFVQTEPVGRGSYKTTEVWYFSVHIEQARLIKSLLYGISRHLYSKETINASFEMYISS